MPVLASVNSEVDDEWWRENRQNFTEIFFELRRMREGSRKLTLSMIRKRFTREQIELFKDYIRTRGMAKIAQDEEGISLSEVKTIGRLLNLKNTAGRKIKDPIMEKNLVEWIKREVARKGRPVC